MQPCDDDFCFGLEMSDIVNANIEKMIGLVLQKLKKWGIEAISQSPSAA
jgi:hypothetical protein